MESSKCSFKSMNDPSQMKVNRYNRDRRRDESEADKVNEVNEVFNCHLPLVHGAHISMYNNSKMIY